MTAALVLALASALAPIAFVVALGCALPPESGPRLGLGLVIACDVLAGLLIAAAFS